MSAPHVAAGALTGFVVGMTGVGGGALMTPILVMIFGTAPATAVGTDLWFAAVTKIAVGGLHVRKGLIDWPIVRRLWLGSLPAAAVTIVWMGSRLLDPAGVAFVKSAIGIAVSLTGAGLLTERFLTASRLERAAVSDDCDSSVQRWGAILAGAILGALVTLTSVGAGALGALALLALYRGSLDAPRLVGTDIAHAIPLALVAGAGHLGISQVDLALLRDLLTGSIPAAIAGAVVSSRVPHGALRLVLGGVLLVVGLSMLAR